MKARLFPKSAEGPKIPDVFSSHPALVMIKLSLEPALPNLKGPPTLEYTPLTTLIVAARLSGPPPRPSRSAATRQVKEKKRIRFEVVPQQVQSMFGSSTL